MKPAKSNKARLFIQKDGKEFQFLSLGQNADGSIYASWPTFSKTIWPFVQQQDSAMRACSIASIDDGKLTIHGSGLAGFREHTEPSHRLRLHGSPLLKKDDSETRGVRHLLTLFPDEPTSLPTSPCFKRINDYSIRHSTPKFSPFVLILFAIPIGITGVNLRPNFHMDFFSLTDILGSGLFSLRFHQILWFMYKNKNLVNWPKKPHCFFHDGYHLPFFVGLPDNSASIEYVEPIYELGDKSVTISWSFPNIGPNNYRDLEK